MNCWNIENAVQNGNVRFSKADLSEGTKATVKCKDGALVGKDTLQCIGGQWDQPLPLCSSGGKKIVFEFSSFLSDLRVFGKIA